MSKPRVLFSIPTRHHVEIALDELEGLQDLGYACDGFNYAAKEGVTSAHGRLRVIVQNALNLVKKARSFKPDIIYLNSRLEALAGMRDFITIFIFKALYRKPVHFLIKSHGSDMDVLKSKRAILSRLILPYLQKNVSGWLFLSSEEQRLLVQSGFAPASRVFVGKNIVRNHHFNQNTAFKEQLNLPPHTHVFLFVGRLIPEKGIYQVLEGYAQLPQKAGTVLIIVGWGPEEERLKQLCHKLQIQDQVIFTGFLPEQEVVNFYANSDVLVFPTYFPEGFPMALFNSVAAGLAVITTRTRAAADYLTAPDNCLWVQAQNNDDVTQAMNTLLTNKELTASMKKNNLLKGKLFNKEQVASELAAIINKVMH